LGKTSSTEPGQAASGKDPERAERQGSALNMSLLSNIALMSLCSLRVEIISIL
jgi:hypothetical protein